MYRLPSVKSLDVGQYSLFEAAMGDGWVFVTLSLELGVTLLFKATLP